MKAENLQKRIAKSSGKKLETRKQFKGSGAPPRLHL